MSPKEKFNKAKNFHLSGNYLEAQRIYIELVKNNKDNFLLHNLIGTTYLQTKNYDLAIKHINISIKINPNFPDNYNNKGIALAEKKEFSEAIRNYDEAILIKDNYFDAYFNKAVALKNIKKFKESIDYFNLCLKIDQKNPKIYNNLGNLFVLLKRYDQALDAFDKAIILDKNFAEAYSNRGELHQTHFDNYNLAIKDYKKAITINNKLDFVYGKLVHAKMYLNDWENFDNHISDIKKGILNNDNIIAPFPLLSLIDEPKLHKIVAEKFSNKIFNKSQNVIKKNIQVEGKIKIGYFSARLHDSPTLHLMLDVFKNHDKSKFEIYGFSHGGIDDYWTKKIKKYFDKFYDVTQLSTEEILSLGKKNKIQVSINLTGHTLNARDEIFFNQISPIQINYLGYPGTLGSKVYDYVIADKIVLPKKFENNYSEKVLHLPDCYQPNQANRKISNKKFKKEYFELPQNKLIFGCFNNSYKITPQIFNCWMEILKKTKNSILWLLQSDSLAQKNLIKEAKTKGINENRIIFAKRVSVEEHLKRISFMDLFLDTYPYNAHTTASEALRMKVPVLTLKGDSFASRVASSLLYNVGLEKLVVKDFNHYIKTAINLANNRELNRLKRHLSKDANTEKIFNSKKFTKNLEKIYEDIVK
jgi:predicted O-linked N-acetylglucosamine transferase (SPINDLY family)